MPRHNSGCSLISVPSAKTKFMLWCSQQASNHAMASSYPPVYTKGVIQKNPKFFPTFFFGQQPESNQSIGTVQVLYITNTDLIIPCAL